MSFLNKFLSKLNPAKLQQMQQKPASQEIKEEVKVVEQPKKEEKQELDFLDKLNPELLRKMIEPRHKLPLKRANAVFPGLIAAMKEGKIDNMLRVSAFIAQVAHESGAFRYMEELASGEAYEGRKNLGNTQEGDGKRFKGRGYIQLTGRTNYTKAAKDLSLPIVEQPELAATYENAPKIAVWFWNSKKLSELADQKQFDKITKLINGGFNGKEDRDAIYEQCQKVLATI